MRIWAWGLGFRGNSRLESNIEEEEVQGGSRKGYPPRLLRFGFEGSEFRVQGLGGESLGGTLGGHDECGVWVCAAEGASHTVEYNPLIKSRLASTKSNLGPYVV